VNVSLENAAETSDRPPDASATPDGRWRSLLRWILILPVAAGCVLPVMYVTPFLGSPGAVRWTPEDVFAVALRALGIGLALFLAARIAPVVPRYGRRLAVGLLVVVAILEALYLVGDLGLHLSRPVFRRHLLSAGIDVAVGALFTIAFWRSGRSGFRGGWRWATVVVPTVAAAVWVTSDWVRTFRSMDLQPETRETRTFAQDGISFRYPANWKLSVEPWEDKSPGHRQRDLVLSPRIGTVFIEQAERPPAEAPPPPPNGQDLHGTRAFANVSPISPEVPFQTTVRGRRISGFQRDFLMQIGSHESRMRIRGLALNSSRQTAAIFLVTDLEDWPLAEPKFDEFLAQIQLD
jgi:hypothetical protein